MYKKFMKNITIKHLLNLAIIFLFFLVISSWKNVIREGATTANEKCKKKCKDISNKKKKKKCKAKCLVDAPTVNPEEDQLANPLLTLDNGGPYAVADECVWGSALTSRADAIADAQTKCQATFTDCMDTYSATKTGKNKKKKTYQIQYCRKNENTPPVDLVNAAQEEWNKQNPPDVPPDCLALFSDKAQQIDCLQKQQKCTQNNLSVLNQNIVDSTLPPGLSNNINITSVPDPCVWGEEVDGRSMDNAVQLKAAKNSRLECEKIFKTCRLLPAKYREEEVGGFTDLEGTHYPGEFYTQAQTCKAENSPLVSSPFTQKCPDSSFIQNDIEDI